MNTDYMPWDMNQLVNDYEFTGSGHFFSRETMRFFKSRLCPSLFLRDEVNKCIYFATSEKGPVPGSSRGFTIRKATMYLNESGRRKYNIETIGSFNIYTRSGIVSKFKEIKKAITMGLLF